MCFPHRTGRGAPHQSSDSEDVTWKRRGEARRHDLAHGTRDALELPSRVTSSTTRGRSRGRTTPRRSLSAPQQTSAGYLFHLLRSIRCKSEGNERGRLIVIALSVVSQGTACTAKTEGVFRLSASLLPSPASYLRYRFCIARRANLLTESGVRWGILVNQDRSI